MTTKEVWQIYSSDLKRFIFSKVKNDAVADDILQDVFIKVHTKLSTLQDVSKLKSWLFSIARYSVLDYFKTSNKTFEIANFEIETQIKETTHTEKECLYGILKSLPKKYSEPLFLSDIKGVKQLDIAKQLNLTLPAVKSQIQRARKMVAQGFKDCCGFVENDNGVLVGEIQEKEDCKICN
ncbi:sigma-70 family RNA polymerase sigma factor [Lacinutrix venerupis]|uniref:RNA polymerase subunit sigma-70 n=1 Tax=Lacinutrix venerupis TaxID=1486034 RepID=A0AAC9LPN0_9FLAO|nr:sigma-70 family RNA polymerase sigma factor [Lacinutrix venerupis]APY01460.1 RNA polymerase subunit sigma-70 [Lacinutrix venerupis]